MTALNEARRVAEAAVARVGKPCHGIVTAVDPVNHAVKVLVQPDNTESGWLPVSTIAAGSIRICRVPDVNEHVTLLAMEGDAEHLAVVAAQFDAVVMPPVSPATGQPAQPGELLIRTGCGQPPALGNQTDGEVVAYSPWLHITQDVFYVGAKDVTVTIDSAGVKFDAADVSTTGNLRAGNGWTGNFADKNGNVITVTDGIITSGG
ncbi:phage baseplate assembly protein V [Gluconobacter thailandicus]|uniref:phage baseplate assembly protein V n=1 Tax=Gluconobacter thailandicus TaxID=257438 RepID=UPI00142F611D|nr:phage baseplate assembly protein V [Gluconobacter thailandicus]